VFGQLYESLRQGVVVGFGFEVAGGSDAVLGSFRDDVSASWMRVGAQLDAVLIPAAHIRELDLQNELESLQARDGGR
jgi:hypothetical protein